MDGEWIQSARKGLGLNQTQFANLLGVHPVTVSNWERGEAEPNPHQRAIVVACIKAAEDKTKQVGKLVGAALVGAGLGMALFLLLKAAFGDEPSEPGQPT